LGARAEVLGALALVLSEMGDSTLLSGTEGAFPAAGPASVPAFT
ncbi:ROK family transcriptional regulator, partial [Streptomyces hydrogenans]